jgi:RNA polymerase sigma factor (sigma-70 family)
MAEIRSSAEERHEEALADLNATSREDQSFASAATKNRIDENLPAPPQNADTAASGDEIPRLAEHLFRHESGKLVSILTGIFGIERLQLAEDVVQEALVRALQTWPYYGIPKNPAAWLTQTAKNLTLDVLRREKVFREKEEQIAPVMEQWSSGLTHPEGRSADSELKDDGLRLMFVCCHPSIPQDAQAALALKTLCGFSPAEIASAFLATEAAIAKRLVRARQRIRDLHIPFEIPPDPDLTARLDGVLQTIYLLFNEGYKASTGESLVRQELCSEAIRLATLLAQHRVGNQPRTHALLALMLLNAARLAERVDNDGNLLRLKEQDRSKWDRGLIARGMFHLAESADGDTVTAYHFEAAIAACHCAAPTYEETDWPRILSIYDRLVELDDSPVIALNRAVAVAQVHGPEAGIKVAQELEKGRQLDSYHLLYAVLGEFEAQLNEFQKAVVYLRKALELTQLKSEQTLLARRLQDCEEQVR